MSFFPLLNSEHKIRYFENVGVQTDDGSHWLFLGKKIQWEVSGGLQLFDYDIL